jgi:hypothetical protein
MWLACGLRVYTTPCQSHTPRCRNEYLAMGMLHVATAVSFLNNDCKMVSCSYAYTQHHTKALGVPCLQSLQHMLLHIAAPHHHHHHDASFHQSSTSLHLTAPTHPCCRSTATCACQQCS